MEDFTTTPRLRTGHRMTFLAWGRPRHFPRLPAPVVRYFDVAPEARVLAECHWLPRPWQHPTLVLLHGLEGSSRAHYMLGLADKALAAGHNVVRVNQRNCGGTEHLSTGLYHSGLTGDVRAVIRELIEVDGLPSIALAGYSLGGNLALKLAGEQGDSPLSQLRSICAVSPTMDLAACVAALERPENLLYELNFVRNLKRRMRKKVRLFPDRYELNGLSRIRTVREFDEVFTAPHHGFKDASDYYYRASAMRVIDCIRLPTLIISADDDPFVPIDPLHDPLVTANPNIRVVVTHFGGHCGFVSDAALGNEGYWAERAVVEFAGQHAAPGTPEHS